MLSTAETRQFEAEGFVRLSGAFSPDQAARMEARVWEALSDKDGIDRDEPSTWSVSQAVGLQALRTEPVFAPIGSPRTVGAIDTILGDGEWVRPRHWGQMLISFPARNGPWRVPGRFWHTDFGYLAEPDQLAGVLVIAFISDVPPGGGGTAVVAGSHRLVGQYVAQQPPSMRERMKRFRVSFLRSDPWLVSLNQGEDEPDRNERLTREQSVAGCPVRVVELSGGAGDVVIGHPWLLHSPAPNCGESPRMMCVQRVRRRDAVPDSIRSKNP